MISESWIYDKLNLIVKQIVICNTNDLHVVTCTNNTKIWKVLIYPFANSIQEITYKTQGFCKPTLSINIKSSKNVVKQTYGDIFIIN